MADVATSTSSQPTTTSPKPTTTSPEPTTTSAGSTTIEINDAYFCTHLKEVCKECDYDSREENDAFFGYDSIDREGIEAPAATPNKDGKYQCKKHKSIVCNQCFGWKKQITRARAAAKKAGKK